MIHILSGPNSFLVQNELNKIRETFVKNNSASDIETYQAQALEPSALHGLLTSATLFSNSRLVIIKHLSENKPAAEQFLELIDSVPHEVTVVLVEAVLDKRSQFYKVT